ncbi:TolC family protein [Mucilaginibacter auburnensis]|uniref:NodT family efflux transporter outer membrane factor (OMF) lipoprotein n=1 Tax=Mucilaginibacter auburnensis TaxID=1457233 RepID=A0A2H9VV66_9SPHI|nr:efflux transporter outer membrane subunit [Mucilaginibacter auburnensis]PJJ84723.1 NodT family efflux transporter outer membrane factor (OMF) lipoprotein [Mucilaginibacter auburnensis]
MLRILKSYKLYTTILLLAMAAGCKNYKAVTVKSDMALPERYIGPTSDSSALPSMPFKAFFSDPHLTALLDTAFKSNLDLQVTLQRVEMAAANFRYNKSLLLPWVNFNATAGADKFGAYTMNGVGNYDSNLSPNLNSKQIIPTNPTPDFFIGVRSSWEVDLWGKLKNQKKAALARYLATQSGVRLVSTELTAQIAANYYELLALDSEMRIIVKNIKLQEDALEIVQIQKQGGRATELAVQQFVAQLAYTKGLMYEVQQQITETENSLRLLTGSFDRKITRDTSIISLAEPRELEAGIPTQLLLNRPDIRQAELELVALNADIRSARAAFFPALTINAYGGYNAFKGALLFDPTSAVFGIVGGLTAPLLNRKRIKSDYEYKVAEARAALYDYQKTIIGGYQEVMNSLRGMDNFRNYYQLKENEVTALNNAVSVSRDLYLVGRATYLEVITAQKNVLDAELQLAVTKKNIFLSEVNLYRALGGGWR